MPRKRTALWTLVGVAVLAAGGEIAWRASDLGRAAADLDRQRTLARREGVPVDYADVLRLEPSVPFDENAAVLYRQAFETFQRANPFKKVRASRLISDAFAGRSKLADLQALGEGLRAAAPALELAAEGSRRRDYSFDRQWDRGSALTFPEFSEARDVERALVLRAMAASSPAAAAADLRTAARMRAHFGSEPLMISALVGNSMEGDVHRGIRAVARRGVAWARAVSPALDDLGPIPALRRSLALEAVWGVHFDDEVAKWGAASFSAMDGTSVPTTMRLMAVPGVRNASKARIFEYWRNAWSKLPSDPTDFRAAAAALKPPRAGRGPSYALLDFLLPQFDGFATANATSEANRRLTREALALWTGRFSTAERDPFGTGSLKLRRNGPRWALYSVGPDGADDGGKPRSGTAEKGYDLVVEG